MTSRERLMCALSGGTPDRVPYCEVGVSGRIVSSLTGGNEHVLFGGIDEMDSRDPDTELAISRLLHRDMICYRLQPPVPAERRFGSDGIPYYLDGPIKSVADLDKIELPDPDDENLWKGASSFVNDAGEKATCLATRIGISAAYLACGMETFSISLYEDPGLIDGLLDLYSDWAARVVARADEFGFDFVWTSDDIAFKTGPLVSPQMFRERIIPFARRVADAVNIPWVYHSDGDLTELMDDLLDLGISAINPIEPEAMDIVETKRKWGSNVCLIGNVSVHTLAAGSPDDVRREVMHLLQSVAPSGGYILSSGNSLASYCKPENVRAMIDTLRAHGSYPIEVSS